jgi:hypothetical protein
MDGVPPLRQIRKLDLRRLNSARKVRKQFQALLQQQYYHEDTEVLYNEFRKLSLPLSPPSRWESIPKETHLKSNILTPTKVMTCVYGKETLKSLPVTSAWKVHSPVNFMNLAKATSLRSDSNTRSSSLGHAPDWQMSEEKIQNYSPICSAPARKLSSSPVRMPVRKNSVDCVPRKPMRGSSITSSRNVTLSILDEALSVCDMCSDEFRVDNSRSDRCDVVKMEMEIESSNIGASSAPSSRGMMPSLPRLTSF